jgi:hypothetical protein
VTTPGIFPRPNASLGVWRGCTACTTRLCALYMPYIRARHRGKRSNFVNMPVVGISSALRIRDRTHSPPDHKLPGLAPKQVYPRGQEGYEVCIIALHQTFGGKPNPTLWSGIYESFFCIEALLIKDRPWSTDCLHHILAF